MPLGNGRFTGTVEPLMGVDVVRMAAWLAAIPLELWPQQNPAPGGELRPAMVNDLGWQGFAQARRYVTDQILDRLGGVDYNPMLSVVMPGAVIPPHADRQLPSWCYRIHVPLISNPHAWFISRGAQYHLQPGLAYLVNTEAEHSVENFGSSPRFHYMFDVRGSGV